jgi:hypothetical protein
MAIMINPGTEARSQTSVENASAVVDRLCNELSLDRSKFSRAPQRDADGFYAFDFAGQDGRALEIEVPGDDPNEVTESRPFSSRRLYVDGSSWLYCYALNAVRRWVDGDND